MLLFGYQRTKKALNQKAKMFTNDDATVHQILEIVSD